MEKRVLIFMTLLVVMVHIHTLELNGGRWKTWFILPDKNYRLPGPSSCKKEVTTVLPHQQKSDPAKMQRIIDLNHSVADYRWQICYLGILPTIRLSLPWIVIVFHKLIFSVPCNLLQCTRDLVSTWSLFKSRKGAKENSSSSRICENNPFLYKLLVYVSGKYIYTTVVTLYTYLNFVIKSVCPRFTPSWFSHTF